MEDRVKAAYYELYAKICTVLAYIFMGVALGGALIMKMTGIMENEAVSEGVALLFLMPTVGFVLLERHCKRRRLQLLCTVRTNARLLYTVAHGRRKRRRRYPVVEYEVEGCTYTAELDTPCYRGNEGEEYAICYDPLNPAVARAARGDD